jgi:hypothetical protein
MSASRQKSSLESFEISLSASETCNLYSLAV